MEREECHRFEPEKLIFELSSPGRRGTKPPKLDLPQQPLEELLPEESRRADPPPLPQVSEADVVRHFTRLSVHSPMKVSP